MAKRIIWTKEALADRIQILDYWYRGLGSKEYSIKLDNTFKNVVRFLSKYPELGRSLDGREERFFVKDAHQIFYMEDRDSIIILHIWDTRRNPDDFPI